MTAPASCPCPKCGYCEAAVVTGSWTLRIDRRIHSMNARRGNYGATAGRYKRDRNAWQMHFRVERINQRIPQAKDKRRVTITRLYSGREQLMDAINFAGGCKLVVDAMVREGLLVDDKAKFLEDHYSQQRGTTSGIVVLIEELG